MKPKMIKLETDADPEVTVIGISSHVQDFRLCWALNKRLGLSLSRRMPKKDDPKAEEDLQRATFDHMEPETEVRYTLLSNRGEKGLLLKEQRQVDFFLVVDEHAPHSPAELLEQVRGSEFVLTAFPLELDKLKEGHKLLR